MTRIALVSCSAKKLTTRAPAAQLYASTLFRSALAYATATCQQVYILSAKHGLVRLDEKLDPYDQRMDGLTGPQRDLWAWRVALDLLTCGDVPTDARLVLLAGKDYAAPLRKYFPRMEEPLAGMEIGDRLRWLRKQFVTTEAAA